MKNKNVLNQNQWAFNYRKKWSITAEKAAKAPHPATPAWTPAANWKNEPKNHKHKD